MSNKNDTRSNFSRAQFFNRNAVAQLQPRVAAAATLGIEPIIIFRNPNGVAASSRNIHRMFARVVAVPVGRMS